VIEPDDVAQQMGLAGDESETQAASTIQVAFKYKQEKKRKQSVRENSAATMIQAKWKAKRKRVPKAVQVKASQVPTDLDAQARTARVVLFHQLNTSASGVLSLEELLENVPRVVAWDKSSEENAFNIDQVITDAMATAKSMDNQHASPDYQELQFVQFRVFLVCIKRFFQYYEIFFQSDKDMNMMLDYEEVRVVQCYSSKYVYVLELAAYVSYLSCRCVCSFGGPSLCWRMRVCPSTTPCSPSAS
jgi:hypothetical protein